MQCSKCDCFEWNRLRPKDLSMLIQRPVVLINLTNIIQLSSHLSNNLTTIKYNQIKT